MHPFYAWNVANQALLQAAPGYIACNCIYKFGLLPDHQSQVCTSSIEKLNLSLVARHTNAEGCGEGGRHDDVDDNAGNEGGGEGGEAGGEHT